MTVVLIVSWFLFLAMFAFIFELQTRWISRFSIYTVFFGFLFLRFGVAVPFSNDVNADVTHFPIPVDALVTFYVAIVLVYVSIAVTLAALLLHRPLLGLTPSQPSQFSAASTPVLLATTLAVSGVVITAWILVPWRDFLGGLQLLGDPAHSSIDYRSNRVSYGTATDYGSSPFAYFGSFMRFAIMPALLWILYFHRRQSRWILLAFWLTLLILLLIGLASGHKESSLLLLVGGAVAWLVRSGRPSIFNWGTVAAAAVLFGALVPLLYHIQYPELTYADILQQTVGRLTVEYSRTAQLRFYFYPTLHPFLHGAGSFFARTLMTILGFNTVDTSPPEIYIPTIIDGYSYGGVWNTGFFAEAWADFGYIGIITGSICVAVLLHTIEAWYLRSERGAISVGTYVALCVACIYITDASLPTAMWTFGILPAAGLAWVLRRVREISLPSQVIVAPQATTPVRS